MISIPFITNPPPNMCCTLHLQPYKGNTLAFIHVVPFKIIFKCCNPVGEDFHIHAPIEIKNINIHLFGEVFLSALIFILFGFLKYTLNKLATSFLWFTIDRMFHICMVVVSPLSIVARRSWVTIVPGALRTCSLRHVPKKSFNPVHYVHQFHEAVCEFAF